MGSVFKKFGDFKMSVEYAMKQLRACFSNDDCTVVLVRLQNLNWSKLKYGNVFVNNEHRESIRIFLLFYSMYGMCYEADEGRWS